MKREGNEAFVNQLKDLRMLKNLSRLQVALKFGKNEDCIANIENGKRKVSINEAARFANIYNVPLDEILLRINKKSDKCPI